MCCVCVKVWSTWKIQFPLHITISDGLLHYICPFFVDWFFAIIYYFTNRHALAHPQKIFPFDKCMCKCLCIHYFICAFMRIFVVCFFCVVNIMEYTHNLNICSFVLKWEVWHFIMRDLFSEGDNTIYSIVWVLCVYSFGTKFYETKPNECVRKEPNIKWMFVNTIWEWWEKMYHQKLI